LEIAVILAVLAACTDARPRIVAPAWPQYRGDLARDGQALQAPLDAAQASKLGVLWRAHLNGAVDATPAVARGLVVVGSEGGDLAAFDETSGHQVWTVRRLGAVAASPTIAADRVYVTTLTGMAYAFGFDRGNLIWKWTAPVGSALWASPVAYRDEVIVGVASPYGDQPLVPGRLYGLSAATGKVVWTSCLRAGCAPGDGIWSTAAIDSGGTAFVGVGNPDDGVLAFDPMTGRPNWLFSLYADGDRDLDVGASPVVFMLQGREVIAQATVEGMLAVMDARTGRVIWSRELVAGSAVHGLLASPAYDGATLYVASASSPTGLFAIDPADGSERWRHLTQSPVYSAPAAGNGAIVFGTGGVFGDLNVGSVEAVSAVDGALLWSFDAHSAVRSGPAVSGSTVLVGDYAGDVIAFSSKR
jgi:polyvinyl alcohol dehydrogenase (cytochrome)